MYSTVTLLVSYFMKLLYKAAVSHLCIMASSHSNRNIISNHPKLQHPSSNGFSTKISPNHRLLSRRYWCSSGSRLSRKGIPRLCKRTEPYEDSSNPIWCRQRHKPNPRRPFSIVNRSRCRQRAEENRQRTRRPHQQQRRRLHRTSARRLTRKRQGTIRAQLLGPISHAAGLCASPHQGQRLRRQ